MQKEYPNIELRKRINLVHHGDTVNAPIAEKLGARLQSELHQCDSDWVLQKVFDIHSVRTIIINADKALVVFRFIWCKKHSG